MPSPFPGMDPFLEGEEWEDFHTRFNTAISEVLSPRLQPQYVVRIERRVYVEHAAGQCDHLRRADVAVLGGGRAERANAHSAVAASSTATIDPVESLLPMPEEKRETYLVIRERQSRQVVTVLETLSPANKRQGSDGRREYLQKRQEVLDSQAHLVELDLLLGGLRLPMARPLPRGDYYAIVSRRERRPRAEVYAWSIRDPLPSIPLPLKAGDPDVPLDLKSAFTIVYDRARYDLSLDYTQPLAVELDDATAADVRQLVTRSDGSIRGSNHPSGS